MTDHVTQSCDFNTCTCIYTFIVPVEFSLILRPCDFCIPS